MPRVTLNVTFDDNRTIIIDDYSIEPLPKWRDEISIGWQHPDRIQSEFARFRVEDVLDDRSPVEIVLSLRGPI